MKKWLEISVIGIISIIIIILGVLLYKNNHEETNQIVSQNNKVAAETKLIQTLPEELNTIEDEAFADCTSLTSISIPASVNNIGNDVFSNCDNLNIIVTQNSYAEQYCKENTLSYVYPESLDGHNN